MDSVDGTFSVDPVSGIVMLERILDRESRDSYRLRVQATDQAGQEGALSSQVGLLEWRVHMWISVFGRKCRLPGI